MEWTTKNILCAIAMVAALVVILYVMYRYQKGKMDQFYADWYYRANYPIGSYDPSRAPISFERRP